MVEMKTVLAELIRHCKLRLAVRTEEILPDTAATLGMSSGLKCALEFVGGGLFLGALRPVFCDHGNLRVPHRFHLLRQETRPKIKEL